MRLPAVGSASPPVPLQWSRADEHGWDPKGPPTLIDLRAGIDESGRIAAWVGEFFIPQQRPPSELIVPLLAASLAGLPEDDAIGPGNIEGNSNIPYKIPNIRTTCHRLESTPLRPSWIRGRPAGCRTPSPTNASWTSSPPWPRPIRSSSG